MNIDHHSIYMRDEVSALISTGGIWLLGEVESGYDDYISCDDAVSAVLTDHKLAVLRADGTVFTKWYRDYYTDHYDAETDTYRDVYFTDSWSNITALCAGRDHIAGLMENGKAVATGCNDKGQCNVSGWTNIVDIAAGDEATLGLRADGSVMAAGNNEFGVCNARLWKNVKRIFAGPYAAVGIMHDGSLVTTEKDWENELSTWTDIVSVHIGVSTVVGIKSSGRISVLCEDRAFKEKLEQWRNIIDVAVADDFDDHYAIGLRSNGQTVSAGSGFWDGTFTDKRIDIFGKDNIKTPEGTKAHDDKNDYVFSSSNTSGFKFEDILAAIVWVFIIIYFFTQCSS